MERPTSHSSVETPPKQNFHKTMCFLLLAIRGIDIRLAEFCIGYSMENHSPRFYIRFDLHLVKNDHTRLDRQVQIMALNTTVHESTFTLSETGTFA